MAQKQKAVVIGGAGFIGSHIVDALIERGFDGGAVVTTPAESIDIATTILGWLKIPLPPSFQGDDFSSLLSDPAMQSETGFAYGEISRFNRKHYVRGGGFKLIHTDDTGLNGRGVPVRPGYEMFNTRNDPQELRNIFDPKWPLAQRLVRELEARAASFAGEPSTPSPAALSRGDQQRLRSLGYIGSAISDRDLP
ncbi:MAG: hypothetical protein IID33_02830 [Planctomycetes bacterium]|nr:hypothetical protein [Planctomycetota bacterium]